MSQVAREWIQFFDLQAETYDQNPFTQHTVQEVDFILKTYPVSPGASILDVGCGTGRHSIEFAKRGYQVTGIDLSEGMLKVAKRKAEQAGVLIDFQLSDATNFKLDKAFDCAICLCEGGVGLIERGESAEAHDLSIFKSVAAHLKPNASFVLTCLNGYSVIRQLKDEVTMEGRFNPATMVTHYVDELETAQGKKLMQIYERLFIAPEVVRMLTQAGFSVDSVYGGTAGHWGPRPLSLDEVEAMFLCRKKGG